MAIDAFNESMNLYCFNVIVIVVRSIKTVQYKTAAYSTPITFHDTKNV